MSFPPCSFFCICFFFFFSDPATSEIYTLSYTTLFRSCRRFRAPRWTATPCGRLIHAAPVDRSRAAFIRLPRCIRRSEEHTSELQSPMYLVCRLLLEKKKKL